MREGWDKGMMDKTQHQFTTYNQTSVSVDKTVVALSDRENIIVESFKKCGIWLSMAVKTTLYIKKTTTKKKKVRMTIFRDFKGQFGLIN